MRLFIAAFAIAFGSTFALAGTAIAATKGSEPAKTKLGCLQGKEKWDAKVGKCVAAQPAKAAKKSS